MGLFFIYLSKTIRHERYSGLRHTKWGKIIILTQDNDRKSSICTILDPFWPNFRIGNTVKNQANLGFRSCSMFLYTKRAHFLWSSFWEFGLSITPCQEISVSYITACWWMRGNTVCKKRFIYMLSYL